jgi:mono/diheme cytochrome c family protein
MKRASAIAVFVGVVLTLVFLPAGETISDEPREAAVAAETSAAPEVAWFGIGAPRLEWASIEPGPTPELAPLAGRGEALFARLCTPCHGASARGDGALAAELPRRPRDLVAGTLRTRDSLGPVRAGEIWRTITAGAPLYGMPSFAHLPALDRWALVAFLDDRRGGAVSLASAPESLPPRRATDPGRGARLYASRCAPCHGARGDGAGWLGEGLRDEAGAFAPPASFVRGPDAFRSGSRAEDVARVVRVGRPGTRMIRSTLDGDDLWAVAEHVARLAREGAVSRRAGWSRFFDERRGRGALEEGRLEEPEKRWDPALSARFATAPAGEAGCLACHQGIAEIASGRMALALGAFAGGDKARACVVCHEGDASASSREAAHKGFVGNPGSLWITSLGLGCGKCHANHGALTTLMGLPLPEAVGGGLLAVVSSRTDPTGASGSNHAYRMQRALMAQETGKVLLETASAGFVERDAPRFTDFAVDDPDGPVPCAGSPVYRAFMGRAIEKGQIVRLEKGVPLPTYPEAVRLSGGDLARAGYVDYFRKECARCHLWGEGKASYGERRSSGCSACHLLNDREHRTAGEDPTVPRNLPGHPLRHEIALAIPESQCNHCHTRGAQTEHSDVHQKAGLECVDCHTSIDVHGDGNLYPSIRHQLEIRCEDCHGSTTAPPWDLPVGNGTKAAGQGPRGVVSQDGVDHLLTDRGNARRNWVREGGRVVVESFATGERHVARLLSGTSAATSAVTSAVTSGASAAQRAHEVAKHGSLACSACHGSTAPRCAECHLTYTRAGEGRDGILSALNYDPGTTRQRLAMTPGSPLFYQTPAGSPWGNPEMRPDSRGRIAPQVRGCRVFYEFLGEDGVRHEFRPHMNPGEKDYPPPIAPTLTHEMSLTARTCVECHPADGSPVSLPGADDPW